MRMSMGKDEWTPAIQKLAANASPERRKAILSTLASRLSNENKRSIAAEKQYDGAPMKSPAKETKFGGRFAKSYNWRYRPGYIFAPTTTKQRVTMKGERRKVRRRVPVTEDSKQLQDTGGTIKSIDILSASASRATVGPKTGHGQKILSVHSETRRPFGISDAFADKARKYAFDELMKGV